MSPLELITHEVEVPINAIQASKYEEFEVIKINEKGKK